MFRVKWKFSGGFVVVSTLAIFAAIFKSCDSENVDMRTFLEVCRGTFVTSDYDANWEEGLDDDDTEWKVRMASKMHIYLMAHNMYQTHKFRKFEEEHFKKACFATDRINGWTFTNTTGYGGRSVFVRLARTDNSKVYRFVLPFGPYGSSEGTASIILSDNDLYTAFEFCFDNGLRTFAVFSRNQINDHRDAIKLHLKSIGFKEDNMVDLKPNNCDSDPKKKDLPKPGISVTYYQGPVRYREDTGYPAPPVFYWKGN